jgi:hypothetical protein
VSDIPTVGARVRVRPGTDDAELVADYGPTGTVLSLTKDDHGLNFVIRLDGGETVWASSPDDWEVIED